VLTAISVIVQPLTSHRRRLRHERRLPGEGTSDAFFVLPRRRGRALLAMVGFFRWKKWL
jgi:hypothetical protein